jgi:hypothetical protein
VKVVLQKRVGRYQVVVMMVLVVENSRPRWASALIEITMATARVLVTISSRIAIVARMTRTARMAFTRMTLTRIGRMERNVSGSNILIAIAIMTAIVVVMTVHAYRINRRANSYRRSDRLCDYCPWRCLLRIELTSRSAFMSSRLEKYISVSPDRKDWKGVQRTLTLLG